MPDWLTGVARRGRRTVESAGLAAVVGTVTLSEFEEGSLRRNLEDVNLPTNSPRPSRHPTPNIRV